MKTSYVKLVVAALAAGMCMTAAANPADLDGALRKARGVAAKSTGEARDFGQNSVFYSAVESAALVPYSSGFNYTHSGSSGGLFCQSTGTDNRAIGQFHMPHGVSLDFFRVWFNDASTQDITVTLQETCLPDFSSAVPVPETLATRTSTGATGDQSTSVILDNRRADNTSCTYRAVVQFGDTPGGACPGSSQWFYKARIEWSRSTPPAPVAATFGDVPTSDPFFAVIEALADVGVTAGCGGGNFCPNAPITRAGIAAMLVRALALQPAFFTDSANP
ncbi:MAG TPA: S-layer homology domain-containing protein [Casimicrobiaceae bacterium]|nr:S-layer homology domain-containing protein [Casimicrobiaceae bacterium]